MAMLRGEEWARLKSALDAARSGTGRPFRDERRTVEAVIWRQRNGAKWRSIPPELSRMGIWERAFEALHDATAYARRHRVENLWARLKEWRALATRYDKTAHSFLGGLYPAAALHWLSDRP
jgi:transposase